MFSKLKKYGNNDKALMHFKIIENIFGGKNADIYMA